MLMRNLLQSLSCESVIEPVTRKQYERAVERFSLHLGRSATIADLTTDQVNTYLVWLKSNYKIGNTTLRNYRSSIIRLWNFASDRYDHPPCIPRRLRTPKKDPVIVRAWSLPELQILMEAAETLPGRLKCGIPARIFMLAWIWVGYETGFRPSDLRLLKWDLIDFDRKTITIIQHKTGRIHTSIFGPKSEELLKKLQEFNKDRVFPLAKWGVVRWERFLFIRASHAGFRRYKGQGIGTLRKCHATEVFHVSGIAAAAESLGHVSGITTARNHYVDSRYQRGYLPPDPRSQARRA